MKQVVHAKPLGRIDQERLQQAAEWFALLQSGAVSDAERQGWRNWLSADEENDEAWRQVENISKRFRGLPTKPARAALRSEGITRRQTLKALALVFMVGGAGWQLARQQRWSAQYQTGRGEIRQFTLADGTQLWLNTNSAVDVKYSDSLREIILLEGELYVETAKDINGQNRPLVVDTELGRLQALGTRFAVRDYGESTRLSVEQGAVQVQLKKLAATGVQEKRVYAGQQLDFSATQIGPLTALQPQAWRWGTIVADNMRLDDFIDELNRYHYHYLNVDPTVADLRLVGAYPVVDVDRILLALEQTLPISVHHTLPWWVKISTVSE